MCELESFIVAVGSFKY